MASRSRSDIIEVGSPRKEAPIRYAIPANIVMSIDAALAVKDTALYVINDVLAVEGQLGDISLTINRQGSDRTMQVRIRATWVPQDLSRQAPRGDLLNDPQFIGLVESGVIKIIDQAAARKIAATQQAKDEWARATLDRAAQAASDSIDIQDEETQAPVPVIMAIPMGGEDTNQPTATAIPVKTADQSMTSVAISNFHNGMINAEALCAIISTYGSNGLLTAKEAVALQSTSLPANVHRALDEVVKSKITAKPDHVATSQMSTPGGKKPPAAVKKPLVMPGFSKPSLLGNGRK